jgi:hypothetical protein
MSQIHLKIYWPFDIRVVVGQRADARYPATQEMMQGEAYTHENITANNNATKPSTRFCSASRTLHMHLGLIAVHHRTLQYGDIERAMHQLDCPEACSWLQPSER